MTRPVALLVLSFALLFAAASDATAAQFRGGKVEVDGYTREFFMHIPVPGRETMSVVFALHGGGGRAQAFATYLDLDIYSNDENILFVYPDGFERHWNDGRTDSPHSAHAEGIDDVKFFRRLVDVLAEHFPVDRDRVYAVGISNGGMMTLRLACEAADLFAAVASIAASMPDQLARDCRPSRPIPILFVSGTDDPMMPYAGGQVAPRFRALGLVRPVEETVAQWVGFNGCAERASVQSLPDADPTDGSRVVSLRYLPCRDGAEVRFLRVDGGGHTWPGAKRYAPEWMVGTTNRDIDANRVVLDFFAGHRLAR